MRRVVDQSVQEYLTEYLELHPDVLDSILLKALNSYKVCFNMHVEGLAGYLTGGS